MYLWYSKKKGKNVGKNCVTTTGAFRPNMPKFGCCGYMSPTCRRLCKPSSYSAGAVTMAEIACITKRSSVHHHELINFVFVSHKHLNFSKFLCTVPKLINCFLHISLSIFLTVLSEIVPQLKASTLTLFN